MNRNDARELIKTTFTQSFEKTRFRNFIINVLNRLDETKAMVCNHQYVKDAFKEHVDRYERLGTYETTDGDKVDVLIVYLSRASKLERARTAIRNFVADHLKQRDEKDAALVAFVSPTEEQWRFSYVKMEYATVKRNTGSIAVETHLTPARRFSYLVGKGESCHTAQTRFVELLQDTKSDPTLLILENAFSVDTVTKEFFTEYRARFEEINATLEKLLQSNKALKTEFESKEIKTVDFAKKLLGQIVFLYFLQKKGWLGVSKTGNWGEGQRDFLRQLANGKYTNFYNDVLEPLFYDTLATDRGHDAWCEHFNCRIPFLNGGLFEPLGEYDWKNVDVLLPNTLFTNNKPVDEWSTGTGVLDLFDRYNFTVNEAEPLEVEVAIDPEMLGKVFENLIEENRRKGLGAFYTPREIVHYMCQESLINYLDTSVNETDQIVPRADLEVLIQLGEQASFYESARESGTKTYEKRYPFPESIRKHARTIDEKLSEVTICDPAVGSGAFLVGMMTEIVRTRATLTSYFNDPHERSHYAFKRHAIQKCLYGVDIDNGAVEIAKLRLWLSLVVDEEDVKRVKPLPNLDFKVIVGDSLLGVESDLFNIILFNKLELLKQCHFDESNKEKKDGYKHEIDSLISQLTSGNVIFDFDIYYSEIFRNNTNKPIGFDLMVGNPPYTSYYSRHSIKEDKKLIQEYLKYSSFQRESIAGKRYHSVMFFLERAIKKLKFKGCCMFIVDMNFFEDAFAGLRSFLLKQYKVNEIVYDLSNFENVNSGQIILNISKHSLISHITIKQNLNGVPFYLDQKRCLLSRNCRINVNQSELEFMHALPLSHYLEVNSGVNIGGASDEFLSTSKNTSKHYPFISTTTLKHKYQKIIQDEKFINFDENIVRRVNESNKRNGSKNVVVLGNLDRFKGEKLFIRQSATELIASFDNNILVSPYSFFVAKLKRRGETKNISLKFILGLLNSKLLSCYASKRQIIRQGKGKQPQIRKSGLDMLPIVVSPNQRVIENIVDYLLLMNHTNNAREDISLYFQKIIDAIVYELYFPREVAYASATVLEHLLHLPDIQLLIDSNNSEQALYIIQDVYTELGKPNHPVSIAMSRLDTIDEIRIIEGT